jgi:hypothetical protein
MLLKNKTSKKRTEEPSQKVLSEKHPASGPILMLVASHLAVRMPEHFRPSLDG